MGRRTNQTRGKSNRSDVGVEPVTDEPVAMTDDGERVLCLADYHAGLEVALRYQGVEIRSRADERRERVLSLIEATDAERLVVLGDLANAIGSPGKQERAELDALFNAVTDRVPMTVVKGNHDGDLEEVIGNLGHDIEVTGASGTCIGDVGFVHGHTWPTSEVLTADTVCVAHEHPVVRLEDQVGGQRIERCWLRGRLNPAAFADRQECKGIDVSGQLIVFPAFNDLLGGTRVNEDAEFLSPFLPTGLADGQAYLLDGTRLGAYQSV